MKSEEYYAMCTRLAVPKEYWHPDHIKLPGPEAPLCYSGQSKEVSTMQIIFASKIIRAVTYFLKAPNFVAGMSEAEQKKRILRMIEGWREFHREGEGVPGTPEEFRD